MTGFDAGSHLQIIDGSGYVFRAFHQAERSLSERHRYRSDGQPVGAVHFFCNMMFRLLVERRDTDPPTHCAVAFDHSAKTFRNQIYPAYKAHRPPPPDDLVPQFPITREAVQAFGFASIELAGFEADDIIATLTRSVRDAGGRVTIISSDKDLMQLVGDGVEMFDSMRNRRFGVDEVTEKFGVAPDRVIDVQALAGDSTDNVPGAPGIGIKTAAQLIGEYGDLDSLLALAHQITQPKRRESLTENAELIRISRQLVTLDQHVPLPLSPSDITARDPDPDHLIAFLRQQEFRTIVGRVEQHFEIEPTAVAAERESAPFDTDAYRTVGEITELRQWIERIRRRGEVAVDTETTGLDEMRDRLVGISLAVAPGQACYVPLGHRTDDQGLLGKDEPLPGQIARHLALSELKPMLEDPSILKIAHNAKFDIKIFRLEGITVAPIDDTMLMSYALAAGRERHGLDSLSKLHLDHDTIPIKEVIGSGRNKIEFSAAPLEQATPYAAEDADVTLRLWHAFKPQLHRNKVASVYEVMERPLIDVLVEMERTGVLVERQVLARMSASFAVSLSQLEAKIHDAAGERFNIASPRQLGRILFEQQGLPPPKKLKSGDYSTSADILEELAAEGHDLPALALDWRHLAKLKSTYTDSLQGFIHPQTGRVHTSYSIAGANTGRLASTDPNLQNIPVRTAEGRGIREAFIAQPGYRLLSLDYSQIELRILAHVANIDSLKDAFRAGEDIHALTASQMFDVPLEGMDPAIRRRAKAVNFGVIYGISAFGLARNLRIPRAEAQGFIDRYFERFPGIRTYMDETVAAARRDGFVSTLFGRRIHTPDIAQPGPRGAFARRAAINAPIQGSAADIIRRAMIRMPPALAALPAHMILQVHDELLFEVRADALAEVTAIARRVMERAALPMIAIDPPLIVDAGAGETWSQAH